MYAVIVTGGKQYKVSEGDTIFVEKLEAAEGDTVTFDKVLAVSDGESITIGEPEVDGASVTAKVVKQGKADVYKRQTPASAAPATTSSLKLNTQLRRK